MTTRITMNIQIRNIQIIIKANKFNINIKVLNI